MRIAHLPRPPHAKRYKLWLERCLAAEPEYQRPIAAYRRRVRLSRRAGERCRQPSNIPHPAQSVKPK